MAMWVMMQRKVISKCNLRKPDLAFLTHLVPEKLPFSACDWRDPGAIVVAFAGTDSSSIGNWISNLNAFKTDYTVGSCEVKVIF